MSVLFTSAYEVCETADLMGFDFCSFPPTTKWFKFYHNDSNNYIYFHNSSQKRFHIKAHETQTSILKLRKEELDSLKLDINNIIIHPLFEGQVTSLLDVDISLREGKKTRTGSQLVNFPANTGLRIKALSKQGIKNIFQFIKNTHLDSKINLDHNAPAAYLTNFSDEEILAIEKIETSNSLSNTEKKALVKLRIGQSLFKNAVLEVEKECRITKINNPAFLIASHIKPWSHCDNDIERLDQYNGLILSPHVDKLFDEGYISFNNNGELLKSPDCPEEILSAWGICLNTPSKPLLKEQIPYMEYHRTHILKK